MRDKIAFIIKQPILVASRIGCLLFLLGIIPVLGQINLDSLQSMNVRPFREINSLKTRTLDSIKHSTQDKFIKGISSNPDTLNPNLVYFNRKLNSIKGSLAHRIDSLNKLNLPSAQYSHLLDSINKAGPLNEVNKVEAKLASLERKVNEPVAKLNLGISKIVSKINHKLGQINREGGPGTNLPG